MTEVNNLVVFALDKIKGDLKYQHLENDSELRISMVKNLTKREIKELRKELTRRSEILENGKVLLINNVLLLLDWLKGNQTHQTLILNYQVV